MNPILKWFSYIILIISITIGTYIWYNRLPGINGLGSTTTSDEAIREGAKLNGKNIIVTGGTTGIGLSTVLAFSKFKTSIWLPTRPESMERCRNISEEIRKNGNPNIFCEEMDLSSFRSIKEFTEKWKKNDIPLHILINNAGIQCYYNETEDGHEMMFGTNHLGHFLLTNLLIEPLKKGNPSRVVTVASSVHTFSPIHWDDLKGKDTWFNKDLVTGYAQSKTANMLFSIELNKKMKGFGHSNSVHPGIIYTTLQRGDINNEWVFKIVHFVMKNFGKTPSQGAATQVYVATAPELEEVGGEYFQDCNIATSSAAEYATDGVEAERLWKLSEELTKKYLN